MKRKWIATIIALCLSFATVGVLSACVGEQGPQGEKGEQGIQGIQGEAGKDGVTPTIEISEDGYWIINGTKTEYKAVGQDGENGNNGVDGENGRGIDFVYYDENGDLVIVYTDETSQTVTLPVHTHVESDWIVDTEATCVSQGLQHKECTACHTYMNIELIDEAHEWETTYSYDEIQHWIECVKCGNAKADSLEEHDKGESSGLFICTKCGYDVSTEGVICELSADKTYAKIVGYEGTESIVYLPNEYQGVPVTHIASYAFEKNENVKRVFFALNLTTIESKAFDSCPNLRMFGPYGNPNGVNYGLRKIESNAFFECNSLAVVELTNNVDDVSCSAFYCCRALRRIYVTYDNEYYKVVDNCHLYTKDGKTLVLYPSGALVFDGAFYDYATSFTVPEGVEKIGCSAFAYSRLETVTIPNTLKAIESSAFVNSSALKEIRYEGTKEQWLLIEKGDDWDLNTGDYVVICLDGELTKDTLST